MLTMLNPPRMNPVPKKPATKCQWFREHLLRGNYIEQIPTQVQLANVFTKSLRALRKQRLTFELIRHDASASGGV